jgi:hypothetical protein
MTSRLIVVALNFVPMCAAMFVGILQPCLADSRVLFRSPEGDCSIEFPSVPRHYVVDSQIDFAVGASGFILTRAELGNQSCSAFIEKVRKVDATHYSDRWEDVGGHRALVRTRLKGHEPEPPVIRPLEKIYILKDSKVYSLIIDIDGGNRDTLLRRSRNFWSTFRLEP